MNTKTILAVLFVLVFGLFTSCSDDDDKKTIEYTINIASVKRVLCYDPLTDTSPYFAKEEKAKGWERHHSIHNFDYEEGYEYLIRVRREYDKSMEGMMDASPYKYYLVEQISKTKKDSENIIDYGYIYIDSKGTGDPKLPYYMKRYWGEDWEKVEPIAGFDYKEGYQYTLAVEAKYNGATASPRYTYKCIAIVGDPKKESEGLAK